MNEQTTVDTLEEPQKFRNPKVRSSCADALAQILVDLGVRRAFGVIGSGIAQMYASMRAAGIELVHARHETGAVFMAIEAHFATDHPVVVFTTTGPGVTNALTGLVAAAWDGAKIIALTGLTDIEYRGRLAFQETQPEPLKLESWLGTSSQIAELTLERADQLSALRRRLATGLARPGGYLVNLALGVNVQTEPANHARAVVKPRRSSRPNMGPAFVGHVRERLRSGDFVIWAGFGARRYATKVRELAERSGARVMASARAKGVFPESHPQYLGVTGMFGAHASVQAHFQAQRPEHVLVLGSRLGQITSCFDPAYLPRNALIHVDVDPTVFGAAYPGVQTIGVSADIGVLIDSILDLWPARTPFTFARTRQPALGAQGHGPVDPRILMAAVQRVIVDRSDATVLAEAGNAFAWANAELHFDEPGRYRTVSGFASMTSVTNGVVGAALAGNKRAVALVGDGAMLMGNEISTAVEHRADAKWIVLNDSSYGMVRHGMNAVGLPGNDTAMPTTNFELLARALGAVGGSVHRASELDVALEWMLTTPGPVVLDVAIDPRPAPSFGRRSAGFNRGCE
jgi:acetolactate synthase-1/2/3 large subunit